MEIQVRTVPPFKDVTVKAGETTISLGLQNSEESYQLAYDLICAAYFLLSYESEIKKLLVQAQDLLQEKKIKNQRPPTTREG